MEKRVLGMARHMGQVFKFEKFKNKVGLDFKFSSSQVGLWLRLDDLPLMSGYGYEIHIQNPDPIFLRVSFNDSKNPLKKKLKL